MTYFVDQLSDGPASSKSLASAKGWLDATGRNPYLINPVLSVMRENYGITLTESAVYNWRSKLTAAATDKYSLLASFDGKNHLSRLKIMLPEVAAFIKVKGPSALYEELEAARKRGGEEASKRSPSKAAVKVRLVEVRCIKLLHCI